MSLCETKINGITLYDVEPRALRIYNEERNRMRKNVTKKHKRRYKKLDMSVAKRKFSAMINNSIILNQTKYVSICQYGKYIFYIDNVVNNVFFIKFSCHTNIPKGTTVLVEKDYVKLGLNKYGRNFAVCK